MPVIVTSLEKSGTSPLYTREHPTPPVVYFTADALNTIEYVVDACPYEIAWLGLVDTLENDEDEGEAYLIHRIYIPEQRVTGATVDVEPDAMLKLYEEIIEDGQDPDTLRYHGHSHVKMGIHPSGTDQEHIADFLEHASLFIREIRNKQRANRIDVFDKRNGVVHNMVQWANYDMLRPDDFYDRIEALLDERLTIPSRRHPAPGQLVQTGADHQQWFLLNQKAHVTNKLDHHAYDAYDAYDPDYWDQDDIHILQDPFGVKNT